MGIQPSGQDQDFYPHEVLIPTCTPMKFDCIINSVRDNIFHLASVRAQEPKVPGLQAHSRDIWTLEDIAAYLRISEIAASRWVKQSGFPRPLTNQHRNRRWLASAVRAYTEKTSDASCSPQLAIPIETNYEPTTIVFKGE